MAITLDDPFFAFDRLNIAEIEPQADSLLNTLTRFSAPVTVFVNGK